MTARSISMAAPFQWFMKALDVGRKNPKALFGGFALVMLVGMVPTVLQMVAEQVVKPAPFSSAWLGIYAVTMVISLFVTPPLLGAALRLVYDIENGRQAQATDVFDGYRDTAFALRMIQVSALMLLVYLVVFGVMFAVMPGKTFFMELFARTQGLAPGVQPDLTGMPAFPPAFLLWLLAAAAVGMVLTFAQMLSLALAALGGERPVAAVAQSFAGVLSNLLPFTGFSIAAFFVTLVLAFVIGLVVALVAGVLAMISPALAIVVVLPVYLAFVLLMYVVFFGFNYHAWLEVYGGEMLEPPHDTVEL